MKKQRSTPIFKYFLPRFVLPALCLWLLSMGLLTLAVAKDFYRQLERDAVHWGSAASGLSAADNRTGDWENQMLFYAKMNDAVYSSEPLLPIVLPQKLTALFYKDLGLEEWKLEQGFQSAIGFYDDRGQKLIVSDGTYWAFSYKNGISYTPDGYGYIDMDDFADGQIFSSTSGTGEACPYHDEVFCRRDRLVGYFDGLRFYPEQLFYRGELRYQAPPSGRETVTLCVNGWEEFDYPDGFPFVLNGKQYENAVALLDEDMESHYGLFSAVIIRHLGADYGGIVKLAVWCNPVEYAVLRLWPTYLVTLILAAAFLAWLLKGIGRNLTEPLGVINRAFAANRVELSDFARSPLEELQTLGSNFETCQQARHQAVNRSVQLQAALDYAKNAEENRRNMVSAIAHELKTPLAVIHSYAEGLQTGIAAQKQEKYLAVIQEETEKLDALVLEMLELSRLEAGKVTLRTDQFSLQSLTERVFQRLALAAQGKQLQIDLQFGRDFTVTADEARMDQVITNFATNAIKYTPAGGGIRVRVQRKPYEGVALFIIENDSLPLSQEALSQIWDSFYRADPARGSGGTGLGLAIAKNIIKLHQGTCAVRNTQTGVEFSFQIPL